MKIRIGIFSFFMGMAVLAGILFPADVYGQEKIHTVLKGETLYSIARALGMKAEELMKYNGITDPARLQAGQRLKIPAQAGNAGQGVQATAAPSPASTAAASASASGGFTSYKVVWGDTFYSIARKFSVTVEIIREANSLPANYLLKEGDSLMIPVKAGTAAAQSPAANPSAANPPAANPPAAAAAMAGTVPAAVQGGDNTAALSRTSWPINAKEMSFMTGKLSGVVLTGSRAEPVKSLTWGTVLSAGPYRGFGRVVIVQVEGGYLYVYGGCESLSVKEGDKIGPGTELGKLGTDIVTNKAQVYFMVYLNNTPVDPVKAPRA